MININPVNFGRTIKINAPSNVAKRMADLVNTDSEEKDSEERSIQQKLKKLFYDTHLGTAQVIDVNRKTYIVTGEESQSITDLTLSVEDNKSTALYAYGNGEMYNLVSEAENKRYKDGVKSIINRTKEPVSIYASHGYIKDPEVGSDRVKVKSINVIL